MNGPLDFTTLKKRFQVSDGTLGMHLQKLEEAGYLRAATLLVGRSPKTTYHLNGAGRKALVSYLESMRMLLDVIETRRTEKQLEKRTKKEPPAIPSVPAAPKVLFFSPKQRTLVT